MKKLLSTILSIVFIISLCFNTTKNVYASDIPTIYKVDAESPRMYESNTQRINIYTKANSKIQYKFWLYSKNDNIWRELTSTYSNAVGPQEIFSYTIPKLKFGDYTLSIWVKAADKEPLNKKGYDNYYAYNFFCSHYDGQVYNRVLDERKREKTNFPVIEKVVAEDPYLKEGDSQTFQVLSKGFEDVQYKVWLNNKKENKWVELNKGYVGPLYAQKVFTISTPNLTLGDYTLSIWIKRAHKEPLNPKGYDSYASFNFTCGEENSEGNAIKLDKLKSNYELNEKIEIINAPDVKTQYRYNIFDVLNNKLIVYSTEYKNTIKSEPLKEGAYILQLDIKTFTEIKVDKDIDIPAVENSELGQDQTVDDEKIYEYKVLEKVNTLNKLIVVGKPYKKSTGKIAYLTFDDGPSTNVTPRILNTLDEYNIKATFFVTGANANSHNDLIKQIYEKGHVIANHSYSHNYNAIYSSTTALINEIQKTYDTIKKIIPSYDTKIFRFPGGSYGKDNSFKLAVEKENYVYFDWNALNGDAEGYLLNKDKLIERTKETVQKQLSVIILMHDASVKTTTADSLPEIIQYLIDNGYEFRTLEEINK